MKKILLLFIFISLILLFVPGFNANEYPNNSEMVESKYTFQDSTLTVSHPKSIYDDQSLDLYFSLATNEGNVHSIKRIGTIYHFVNFLEYLDIKDINNGNVLLDGETTIESFSIPPGFFELGENIFNIHRIEYDFIGDTGSLNHGAESFIDFNLEVNVIPRDATPPIIIGPSELNSSTLNPRTINDILHTLTAYDYSGKDISQHLSIIHDDFTENNQLIGEYLVKFEVTDDLNNTTTHDLIVIVAESFEPSIKLIGDAYTTIEVHTNYFEPGALVSKSDGTTGIANIMGSVNTSKLGDYVITYSYTFSDGVTRSVQREVTVIDTTKPILEFLNSDTVLVEVNTELEIPLVSAYDNYDQSLEINTAHEVDLSQVGTYTVIYTTTDSSGNSAIPLTGYIKVVDTTRPTLTAENLVTNNLNPLSLNEILSTAEAFDEYDGILTSSIQIYDENYTSNKDTPGVYDVTFIVQDSSMNTTTKTISVTVEDHSPPILDSPSYIFKNLDYIVSSEFFLDYVTASDYIDGDLTEQITISSNDFYGNANKRGIYQVIISVQNSRGITSTKSITIEVPRRMAPLMIIDTEKVILSDQVLFSDSDLIKSFIDLGIIPSSNYSSTADFDNYSSNYDLTGTYTKSINLISDAGNDFEFDLEIIVVESDFDFIIANSTLFTSSIDFVKKWWWLSIIALIFILGIKNKQ